MSTQSDTVNNEEINMMNVERNLQEWNIPNIPTKIYGSNLLFKVYHFYQIILSKLLRRQFL
jgi:hypothetical protein